MSTISDRNAWLTFGGITAALMVPALRARAEALRQEPPVQLEGLNQALLELLQDREFWVRCSLSLPIGAVLYTSMALLANYLFPRVVIERGARPPVHSWSWRSDFSLALLGLLAGTPMVQLFNYGAVKYGSASGMLLYSDPLQYGPVWALAQIPIYLLLWDVMFYVLHRFVLHLPWVYKGSHVNHHVFRPPTAWSGIAVDPFDVIFEGIVTPSLQRPRRQNPYIRA